MAALKPLMGLLAGKLGSNQGATVLVKTGRTLYVSSAAIILLAFYSASRNEHVPPSKGKFSFWFPGVSKGKKEFPADREESEQEGWQPAPSSGWGTSKSKNGPEPKSTVRGQQAGLPQTPNQARALSGIEPFDGHMVAKWIIPYLQYARARGWKGTVNSGYRSYAEQKRIYDSGVRPAAVPGTSNHEGKVFPRGAVDVSEAPELSQILQKIPGGSLLEWAGAADPVHFSHHHNGSY